MLMAADIEVPQHVFVHGFLLGADGRKMSKSLGNVLDPFEVIDEFGTDALRFYLMRDVAFGSDGAVGMDVRPARYEAELANEYGNLASRTIAMIARYRDGGRARRSRPTRRCAPEFAGCPAEVAALLDRAEADAGARADLAARAAPEPLRRGAGAVAAGAGPDAAPDALDQALASLAEGLRVVSVLLRALHAGEHRAAARRARTLPAVDCDGAAFAAQGGGGRWSTLAPLFPKRACTSDRQPHPPGRLRAARRRARRGRRGGGRDADRHGRHRPARRAGRRSRRPRASRRCTPRSGATRTRRPASTTPTWPSWRRSPRTSVRRDRRDRARLLPRLRPARRPAARVRGPDRARARATGKPLVIHTRAADDDTLAMLDAARRRAPGDPALLLDGRADRRVPRARDWWISFAGNVTYPKARRPARRARCASRPSGCWSRPTRPICRRRRVRGKPNEPANVVQTARALAVERRVAYDELEATIERQPRRCSDGEQRARHGLALARARARPELPRRLATSST